MYDSARFSKERKGGDPPPNLIYHTHSVKTISGIPYTMSNSCLAHGLWRNPQPNFGNGVLSGRVISCRGVSPPLELPRRPVVRRFTDSAVLPRSGGNAARAAPPKWGDPPRRAGHPA